MLKYMRNKLVSIFMRNNDTFIVHGVLDDDVYSLELDITIRISDLEILSIEGKWNRYTTPECPRANQFLHEAVGFRIGEEGFSQKVHKIVGRKACRHYANLLLECCHSAVEAVKLVQWEKAKENNSDLSFEDFIEGESVKESPPEEKPKVTVERIPPDDRAPVEKVERKEISGGMMIDLHLHTSPASQCSSAPVDLIIEEAKGIGLDGICLTDHNYVWSPNDVEELRQKHGFLVLRGNEITTDQGDMLVFGLYTDIKGIIKLNDLRKEVLDADGFMIVAHPFRGFLTFGVGEVGLTPEKAMERPLFKLVDAVEILNGKVTQKENKFASKVAAGLGLLVTGGSDAHEVEEVGKYATQFEDMIKNEKDLIDALKNGKYSPVFYRKEMVSG